MTDATYWIFFGLMPATVMLLGWAAYLYTRWSLEADERKSKANRKPVGGAKPPT
jgi:hypothetical protein